MAHSSACELMREGAGWPPGRGCLTAAFLSWLCGFVGLQVMLDLGLVVSAGIEGFGLQVWMGLELRLGMCSWVDAGEGRICTLNPQCKDNGEE